MKKFTTDINNFFKPPQGDTQDPLFLTFLVQFDFKSDKELGFRYDNIGSNFLTKDKADSTINTYYNEILGWEPGEKAKVHRNRFVSGLYVIENNYPWFFTSITGLEKIIEYKESNSYWGGDDSVITINCLESINMRVSDLMQAYRDATFDTDSWSWIVPDNLRKFNVTIWVTDIRRLGSVSKTRNWFKFTLSECEFVLGSGSPTFSELSSAPTEMSTQSISFKYENAKVESLNTLSEDAKIDDEYLKEKFGDERIEVGSAETQIIKDIDDNQFGLNSASSKSLSKAWIDKKNQEITDRISRGVKQGWRVFENKVSDEVRGLLNFGISRIEEQAGDKLGIDNFRVNPSSLANNVIKGLNDLSDKKSREVINSLLNTGRKIEPLEADENIYGDLGQILDSALDRKLQGYNNFIGQGSTGPGPLGPENVYDPE